MNFLTGKLDCIGKPIVVDHASGRIIAIQLAENEPDRVRAIIYVAGMMLLSGTSFVEFTSEMISAQPGVV